ncbi:MAG: hypothetical protein ACRCZE_00655 [Candidatus Altimarinota bacterium]
MTIVPKNLHSLAGQINVRSAINPMIWLCAVSIFLLAGALFSNTLWLQIALFILAAIPWLITGGAYIYFMIVNPDYLRSEEYQLESKKIALGDKDNPKLNLITDSELSKNPALIESVKKGDENE